MRYPTLIIFAILLFAHAFTSTASADQIFLNNETLQEEVVVGDCRCSTYRFGSQHQLPLSMDGELGELSAGELWSFFDDQGLTSVDSLVFCLDTSPLALNDKFGLDTFAIRVDGSEEYSLQTNSIVFNPETLSKNSPECRIEIALGYNFMERFAPDSTEKIHLHADVDAGTAQPMFFIEGKRPSYSLPNLFWLGGFIGFWIVAFWLLRRFTLDAENGSGQLVTG